MIFHGFDLEIDGTRGDPSEPDPRFRDDEMIISGISIADELIARYWFNKKFKDEIEEAVKKGKICQR